MGLTYLPTYLPALSNRAACLLLQTGDLQACVSDCDKAIEFIPEKLPAIASAAQRAQNAKLRLRVLVRRGTARCQLGEYDKGGEDYALAKVGGWVAGWVGRWQGG